MSEPIKIIILYLTDMQANYLYHLLYLDKENDKETNELWADLGMESFTTSSKELQQFKESLLQSLGSQIEGNR